MASFGLDDVFSGSTFSGMASGALAGGAVGGWPGAIIGGLGGAGIGAYSNYQRDNATQQQKSNIDQLLASMHTSNSSNMASYLAGLNKALAYYGPAQEQYSLLYGRGGAASTGKGVWGNTGV